MKHVLITGARGMLGQALARSAPDSLTTILWDQQECDLTQKEEVLRMISSLSPSWILNCAAYNAVDRAESDRGSAFAVNRDAVAHVRNAAELCKARLVHISSDYVFDGLHQEGYCEEDAPHPLSIYGASKLAGEQEALRNPQTILVRTSRLFGIAGAGKKSFVDMILQKAKDQDRIEVIDEGASSPTFVDDLAKEIWKMVVEPLSAAGIYHRTNDGECTWYQFAQEIMAQKKIDCELVPVDSSYYQRAAQRPKYSKLISTKLPPLRSWQEALKEYLASNF